MNSSNPVPKLYQSVVDDVISGVRDAFLDEGVDQSVLMELKQLWENKMQQSKAVDQRGPLHEHKLQAQYAQAQAASAMGIQLQQRVMQPAAARPIQLQSVAAGMQRPQLAQRQLPNPQQLPTALLQSSTGQLQVVQAAGQPTIQQPLLVNPGLGQIAIQTGAKAYYRPGYNNPTQQLQTHSSCDYNVNQQQPFDHRPHHSGYPVPTQGGHQLVLTQLPQASQAATTYSIPTGQTNGTKLPAQVDGAGDTSSSSDDDDDEENDDEAANEDNQGHEEEPLNSGDDVSEDDPQEVFDTDNVIVCQYDKINRNKNKWRFHLKDGIMNLNGKDYVFQKANGESEW